MSLAFPLNVQELPNADKLDYYADGRSEHAFTIALLRIVVTARPTSSHAYECDE